MKKYFLLLTAISLLFNACEKKDTDNEVLEIDYPGMIIKSGYTCGWCVGGDSLILTGESGQYYYGSPCYEGYYDTTFSVDANTWKELNDLLDLDKFLAIDINKCYMCADGCDYWLSIEYDTISHYIRYGYPDSAVVAPIQPFIDKLNEIQSRFQFEPLED